MPEHPNYTKQKSEARLRALDLAHLEALAENIRFDINEALRRHPGFELDVDRWGDGGIVLRHFPNLRDKTYVYDFEIPLEGT